MRQPSTGVFQMAVRTVLPRHMMSRGRPTLTESKRGIALSTTQNAFLRSELPSCHSETDNPAPRAAPAPFTR